MNFTWWYKNIAVAAASCRRFIVLYTYNLLSLAPNTRRYVCHMTEWLIIEYREFKGMPLPLHLKQSSSNGISISEKEKKLKIFNNNQKWVWPEMLKSWYDLQSFIVCEGSRLTLKWMYLFDLIFLRNYLVIHMRFLVTICKLQYSIDKFNSM